MKLIGICGPSGSGKSTLAKQLQTRGYVLVSFATPIKLMCEAVMKYQGAGQDVINYYLYGEGKDEPNPFLGCQTSRFGFQTLGTEWGRNIMGNSFWTDMAFSRTHSAEKVVIDDVRFITEAKTIKFYKGNLVRLEREGNFPDNHISERQYLALSPDVEIINNGTPQQMLEKLEKEIEL